LRALIFAGGAGTRLSEETHNKPKPLVTVGEIPILQHIINWYAKFGITKFTALTGYKGFQISEYFEAVGQNFPELSLETLQTGETTQTGGRLRVALETFPDESFLVTYGDGICDVDIASLVKFHEKNRLLATVTAVRPAARFGSLEITDEKVTQFKEKDQLSQSWINGGYFVINRKILRYLGSDDMPFERDPLSNLAKDGELGAFKHHGAWFPMDTMREKIELEKIWASGQAPWK
jgi:glucose-1-phosphate cytidylyltransferase